MYNKNSVNLNESNITHSLKKKKSNIAQIRKIVKELCPYYSSSTYHFSISF